MVDCEHDRRSPHKPHRDLIGEGSTCALRRLAAVLLTIGAAMSTSVHAAHHVVSNRDTTTSVVDTTRADAIYYPMPPRREHATPQDEIYPEDVLRQFLNFHSAMQYERAAESALRLIEMVPDEPIAHYNYACTMVRLRRAREALAAIDHAIEYGWRNIDHLRSDPDLAMLRDLPAFQERLDELEALIEEERVETVPLRGRASDEDRIEAYAFIDLARTSHRVEGLVVTVLESDGARWSHASGTVDGETDVPMQTSSLYRLDDAVDLLLAMSAARLEHAGIWSMAALYDHLYAEAMHRQLATRDRRTPAHSVALPSAYTPRARLEPFHARALLTAALESATGESVITIARTIVLNPHDLTDTHLGVLPKNARPRLVAGHSQFGTPVQLPDRSGLYATSDDLAQLLATVIHGGRTPARGAMTLGDDTTTAIERRSPTRDLLPVLRSVRARVPAGLGLSIDLVRTPYGERFILEARGCGMGCLLSGYPRSKRGISILYNNERGAACAREIARFVLGGA